MRAEKLFVRSLFAAAAGAALTAGGACITTETYVYSARKYDPANACLQAYQSIETVSGKGARSLCAPTCLSVNGELYVSTMCPPLPAIATEVAADASDCKAALGAKSCDEETDGGNDDGGDEGGDGGNDDGGNEGGSDAGGEGGPLDSGADVVDASDAG